MVFITAWSVIISLVLGGLAGAIVVGRTDLDLDLDFLRRLADGPYVWFLRVRANFLDAALDPKRRNRNRLLLAGVVVMVVAAILATFRVLLYGGPEFDLLIFLGLPIFIVFALVRWIFFSGNLLTLVSLAYVGFFVSVVIVSRQSFVLYTQELKPLWEVVVERSVSSRELSETIRQYITDTSWGDLVTGVYANDFWRKEAFNLTLRDIQRELSRRRRARDQGAAEQAASAKQYMDFLQAVIQDIREDSDT